MGVKWSNSSESRSQKEPLPSGRRRHSQSRQAFNRRRRFVSVDLFSSQQVIPAVPGIRMRYFKNISFRAKIVPGLISNQSPICENGLH